MNRRLYRSLDDKVIGGVAGGVAEYLDLDPSIVRVVWAVLAFFTAGVFFVLYIVMWIVVPLSPEGHVAEGAAGEGGGTADPATGWVAPRSYRAHRRSGSGSWVFGLFLIGLGGWFLAREYWPGLDFDRLWPLGLVILGVVLLLVALRRRPA